MAVKVSRVPRVYILLLGGVLMFLGMAAAYPVFGFIRSSANYRIQADSLNVGGAREFSTNYRAEDTIGEIASDESQSASYKLKAGYQQMLETYLAITSPVDMSMPTISGIGPSGATGDVIWTVTTDNLAGYALTINASTAPALQCNDGAGGCEDGVDAFADYTPVESGTPDFSFSVAAADSEFGFSPEGSDIAQLFLDNGIDTCNTGASDTSERCWYNLATSETTISNSFSSNHPNGTATTVIFQTGINSSAVQVAGTYDAGITVTATAN